MPVFQVENASSILVARSKRDSDEGGIRLGAAILDLRLSITGVSTPRHVAPTPFPAGWSSPPSGSYSTDEVLSEVGDVLRARWV
jgi:hypothetical protein